MRSTRNTSPLLSRDRQEAGTQSLIRLCSVGLALAMTAQSQTQFEVASVKRDSVGSSAPFKYPACAGATFIALTPVRTVISWAYDIRLAYKTPDWASMPDERYSIQAKAAGLVSEPQCKLMVQGLLADRFKLKLHREPKEMPVYFLVAGKNGSKLRAFDPDNPGEGIQLQGRKLGPKGAWDMSLIASYLGELAGRPVVDKTSYKGKFVFSLEYSRKPGDDRPDIFTAVQEQLGLKMEPGRGTVEITVIDHLDKPSEN